MLFQTKTRRNAVIALILVCLLVCGGLGWATYTGIRLEGIEAEQLRASAKIAQSESKSNTKSLTLAHLDGIVDSTLAVERTRPFEHYRAFYKPARAVNFRDGLPTDDEVILPSPLQEFQGPDWELLHFQVSVTHGWSSPQLERDDDSATPAGAIPASERAKQASAANWLAALRERCDAFTLQQMLEMSQQADLAAIARLDASQGGVPEKSDAKSPVPLRVAEQDRSAAEFARRGQELVKLQRQHQPAEQCQPLPVAIENFQTGQEETASTGCYMVSGTPMFPVWLDLTLDGRRQLALVRSVSVEHSQFCTLQGVLLDWDALKKQLDEVAREIIPNAYLEPVAIGTPYDLAMMRTIPARLITKLPEPATLSPDARGWTWVLVLTWCATVLALAAICYGTMKYVSMLERRMQFVAAVTHELRTPLTSFQIYTDLLADLGDNPTRREQYVETLRRESKRLSRLVENVLVYSKIGDARPHLNKASVTPRFVLDAVCLQMKEPCLAAGKQILIEDHCGDQRRIDTDSEFVIQILANLLENACKYSSNAKDPRIWLTATPWGESGVAFEVEDLGAGVAASDRKAIFKPFRRGATAHDGGKAGMGLGLALSRYWATCLGGRLELKRGEHNGAHYTRFSLCLPGL